MVKNSKKSVTNREKKRNKKVPAKYNKVEQGKREVKSEK